MKKIKKEGHSANVDTTFFTEQSESVLGGRGGRIRGIAEGKTILK